jgi:hypothetical protein
VGAALGFVLAASALSCSHRSLVLIDVTGSEPFTGVRLTVTAGNTVTQTWSDASFDQTNAYKIGIYLPSDMSGTVGLVGRADDGTCVLGNGTASAMNVHEGDATPVPVRLVLAHATVCTPVPDGGGTGMGGSGGGGAGGGGGATGAGGQGGSTGTGGGGGGGATGTGGFGGATGAGGFGGATGTGGFGGAAGTGGFGGATGAGGIGGVTGTGGFGGATGAGGIGGATGAGGFDGGCPPDPCMGGTVCGTMVPACGGTFITCGCPTCYYCSSTTVGQCIYMGGPPPPPPPAQSGGVIPAGPGLDGGIACP